MVLQHKIKVRTDLADEILEGRQKTDLFDSEKFNYYGVLTTRIVIHRFSDSIGKEPGTYYSIEFDSLHDQDEKEHVETVLTDNLKRLVQLSQIPSEGKVLIVGLGNQHIIADALGPMVVSHVIVTSHVFEMEPKAQQKGMKSVSVMTPGVMGQTGLETASVVEAIVERTNPDLVIIIDALATRNLKRINKVIQLTNTGINPGSGVHNHRQSMSRQSLKRPVIVLGVATVVEVSAIVEEVLTWLKPNEVNAVQASETIRQILEEKDVNLIVTPKEIDEDMKNLSEVIGRSLNEALQPVERM